MAIFVKGDIHGDPSSLSFKNFPQGKELTKEDYVIILGDFGLVWANEQTKKEKYWLEWLDNKPWTTLFIAGNHDNYDKLATFPIEKWNGGYVQKIMPSVIHLMHGEIYDLNGKSFLALEGAQSHDIQHGIIDPDDYIDELEMREACKKLEEEHGGWQFTMYRIKGISWWEQEIPSQRKLDYAEANIAKHNNKVDYVLSHEGPASDIVLLNTLFWGAQLKPDNYSKWLEKIRGSIKYNCWYFGHYHVDKHITYNDRILYENIEEIF